MNFGFYNPVTWKQKPLTRLTLTLLNRVQHYAKYFMLIMKMHLYSKNDALYRGIGGAVILSLMNILHILEATC